MPRCSPIPLPVAVRDHRMFRTRWPGGPNGWRSLPPRVLPLFHTGRLDAQSEGLLILTNDGEFAQKLMHPRYKIEKEYEVTLDRRWDPALATKLLRGIYLDGQRAQIARLVAIGPTRLRVVLRQGINRQIRRMF